MELPRVKRTIAFVAVIALMLSSTVEAQVPDNEPMFHDAATAAVHRGGMEISAGAQGLRTFGRTSAAGHAEFAYRSAGKQADRKGPFSIGLAATFHPMIGRWQEVPVKIGHMRDLNFLQQGNSDPVARVAGTDLRAGDVFLSTISALDVTLNGRISFSPSGQNLFTLDLYELRDVRMDMVGIMLPMRWHFGQDAAQRARFFAEVGVGADLLRTSATYDLTRTKATITFEQQFIVLNSAVTTMEGVDPMDGKLSQDLLFTRAMLGGGVDLGRSRIFLRLQHSVSKGHEMSGTDHRRVRGNVLMLPVLASAWDDPDVASTLGEGGIVPFGRTGIPRDADSPGKAASSDRINGVYRFWDSTQVLAGLSFVFR